MLLASSAAAGPTGDYTPDVPIKDIPTDGGATENAAAALVRAQFDKVGAAVAPRAAAAASCSQAYQAINCPLQLIDIAIMQ